MADLFDLAAKTDWADLMVLRSAGFRSVQLNVGDYQPAEYSDTAGFRTR